MNPAKSILLVPLEIPFINPELPCLATILAEAIGCIPMILCIAKTARELPNFGQLRSQLSEGCRVELHAVTRQTSTDKMILMLAHETGAKALLLTCHFDHWLRRWQANRVINCVIAASSCPVWVFRTSRHPEHERVELRIAGEKKPPFLLSFHPRLLSLPNERLVLMSMANKLICTSHERT